MNPLDFLSNAGRAKEIATVLIRYGFGDLLEQLGLPKKWINRLVPEEHQSLTFAQRVRIVCEELGTTFIKLGQVLSNRPDVLPEPLIAELKLLRDKVRATPFADMKPVLIAELGGEIEHFFSEFDIEPLACGSLGQVYRARLREGGEEVAVKIQRPGIRRTIRSDFEMIGWLARQVNEHVEELRPYDPPSLVEQARLALLQELDFSIEARNAEFFNRINPNPEEIFAPRVYDQFTTGRLTVTEYVRGATPDRMALPPEKATELARAGAASVFHQIVIAGFFHADPHTGNILLTPDGRLCLLDWGLAGQLTREMRYFLADLFSGIAQQNPEKVVRVASLMAERRIRVDRAHLEKEVSFVLRKYQARDGDQILRHLGLIMVDLLYVFGMNGIHLARDYSLLAKSVLAIEENGRALDPEFDIRTVAEPFLQQLSWERWNPVNLGRQTWWSLHAVLTQLRELPAEMQRFLRHLEDGEVKIRMEHTGLKDLGSALDSIANRLTVAIITAALLIGSSLVITTGVTPVIWGYPAIGILGYLSSTIFGIWLIVDIIRHSRHK